MIYQITDPTKIIDVLASLIIKEKQDLSNILIFVPTRRSQKQLEIILSQKMKGAVMLPEIIPLGEVVNNEEEISNLEKKINLTKILLSVSDKIGVKSNFSGAMAVASEILIMQGYLKNEELSIKDIDWKKYLYDESKIAFLNAIKDLDLVNSPETKDSNVLKWKNKFSKYKAIYCVGSTGSVKSTRDLMNEIYKLSNGYVILPGLVSDFNDIGRTDPYWSIKEFSKDKKIEIISTGSDNKINFFNECFNNDSNEKKLKTPDYITEINSQSESEEANSVALICALAKSKNESVLIITPDISGEQRIKATLSKYNLSSDSSYGRTLFSTNIGRFILRVFDFLLGTDRPEIIAADLKQDINILKTLKYTAVLKDFVIIALEKLNYKITDSDEAKVFFDVISDLSEILKNYNLDISDIALILSDTLKKESVRSDINQNYDVRIFGTAEARMQTADVVIITGLNEGMFPSEGFKHSWLPRDISYKIGLPSSDSKVSLMALDFMTLSCGKKIYWTRSKMAGGLETIPSRFLSRVSVKAHINQGSEILEAVRALDKVSFNPIDNSMPIIKYNGDYYATWIEDLIHNPYLFYAKHILNLRKNPDIGDDIGAKEFGTFVHSFLEHCNTTDKNKIISFLEIEAEKYVDKNSILFRFWQNRFREMAPFISEIMSIPAEKEKKVKTRFLGRNLIAKVDRIENGNRVIDFKTGTVPSAPRLGLDKDQNCTMPQLPIEAMILSETTGRPVTMAFASLKKGEIGIISFDEAKTLQAINAVEKKLNTVFHIDKFKRPEFVEDKYKDFDDLCRAGD